MGTGVSPGNEGRSVTGDEICSTVCRTEYRRITVSFNSYIKRLCLYGVSSSLSLGLVLGIVVLIVGETSMTVSLALDIALVDGLLLMLASPLVTTLVLLTLSPLSFWVHKLMSKRGSKRVPSDV